MANLDKYGWTKELAEQWRAVASEPLVPARVVADFGTSQRIAIPEIRYAEAIGKLLHTGDNLMPKIGDWVGARPIGEDRYKIELVLPRTSELARKAPGNKTERQVIAANIDKGFVIVTPNNDFSPERINRFLYQLSTSKILPVIVLNKSDLVDDLQPYISQIDDLGAPIIVCAAMIDQGINTIADCISPGSTAVLLGSSGVGKSTITNALIGRHAQMTQEIRQSDSTGKHTTVHRELFMLPNGGMLIDSPGIRELQLWGDDDALDDDYSDIVSIINNCKFSSCKHQQEPGCKVQQALADGTLQLQRWQNYKKMKSELLVLSEKQREKRALQNRMSRRDRNRRDRDQARDTRDQSNYR